MDVTNDYPIIAVCAKELELAGYDIANVNEQTMYRLAERMQESYLSSSFYRDIRRAANELGIPKIKRK